MARVVVLVAGAALASAIVGACSSNDEPAETNEPVADGAVADTTLPSKACDNDPDRDAVFGRYCPGDLTFKQLNSECAIECLLKRDAATPTCVYDCLALRTAGRMSSPCLTCYDKVIACARENCVAECAGDSYSLKCTTCMCGDNLKSVNCYTPLNACSGLGFTFCQEVEAGTYDAAKPTSDPSVCPGFDAGSDVRPDVRPDAPGDARPDAPADTRMDAKADVKPG